MLGGQRLNPDRMKAQTPTILKMMHSLTGMMGGTQPLTPKAVMMVAERAAIIRQSCAEAFKAVAAHLRATAADFRELAASIDVSGKNHFLLTSASMQKQELESYAQLLDGQAGHIEGFV